MALAFGSALLMCATHACTEPNFVTAPDPSSRDAATRADAPHEEDPWERAVLDPSNLDASSGAQDGASATRPREPDAAAAPRDGSSPTPARPPSDAAPRSVETGDAAVPADAGVTTLDASASLLPPWAKPLLGTYAKRSISFSYDDALDPPFNTRNVEHTIVRITEHAGELLFASEMCSYTVTLKGQGAAPLIFKNATGFPVLRGRITLTGSNGFSSEAMLNHVGFAPSRANSCSGGVRREKYEEQTWISGASCQCYPTSIPEHIDDCRVIDGDGDGLAGVSVRGPSPLGTTISDYLMVFDYSLKIVDGQIGSDGLPSFREVRAQAPACINSERDRCTIGNNELCPGGSMRLLRLAEGATCADLNQGNFGPLDTFPNEVDCRAKP